MNVYVGVVICYVKFCMLMYSVTYSVYYVLCGSLFFGEPKSSALIEHTPSVGTSAFSQLTPTHGTYWNPLPRSDEVPKLGVP